MVLGGVDGAGWPISGTISGATSACGRRRCATAGCDVMGVTVGAKPVFGCADMEEVFAGQ